MTLDISHDEGQSDLTPRAVAYDIQRDPEFPKTVDTRTMYQYVVKKSLHAELYGRKGEQVKADVEPSEYGDAFKELLKMWLRS